MANKKDELIKEEMFDFLYDFLDDVAFIELEPLTGPQKHRAIDKLVDKAVSRMLLRYQPRIN